jgi:uncharacterized protein YkwD
MKLKKTLAFLLTIAIVLPLSVTGTYAAYERITTADALLALQSSAGLVELTEEQKIRYGVSGDRATTAEALRVLKIAAGIIHVVTRIDIDLTRTTYEKGASVSFNVNVYPDYAEDTSYTVKTSDEDIIIINDDGSFTCIAHGTAEIIVTSVNGVSRTREITVYDMDVLAAEVVSLTNIERVNNGLPALQSDNLNLNAAAMKRAEELLQSYTHNRPDGRSFSTVFNDFNVTWRRRSGENIYEGPRSPSAAVSGWMNSPGHRRNILQSDFESIGVGVAMNDNGRLFWVQLFIG